MTKPKSKPQMHQSKSPVRKDSTRKEFDQNFTPVSEIGPLVENVRSNWVRTRALYSPSFRKDQLHALSRMIQEQEQVITQAVYADLQKSYFEALVTETAFVINEIAEALHNLDTWSKPAYPSRKFINWLDTVMIRQDPLGVVLVIGPWNYPFQLLMIPLISAIAAGNACILKPSEISSNTARVVADLIPIYLDTRFFQVVSGGVPETTELLKHKFDHIFFTGNGTVGKVIMTAAAQHLTPVTLELGGKSPTIIHPSADLHNTARRIIFGKFMNAGQICVAPDYVLISKDQQDELVRELRETLVEFYGTNPKESNGYGRIVNTAHFDRLEKYVSSFDKPMTKEMDDQAKSTYGGQTVIGSSSAWSRDEKYIPPTVLANVGINAPIMDEEIFGPILPIIPIDMEQQPSCTDLYKEEEVGYKGDAFMQQACAYVNARGHALAMYVFGTDNDEIQWFLDHTHSGGVTVNDTIMHLATPGLPFGGVGASGMGSCHGKFGFDTFSHKRAVLHRPMGLEFMNTVRYSPLTERRIGLFKRFALAKI